MDMGAWNRLLEVEMKAELNQLQEEMAEMKKNVKKKLSRARRVHGKLANWLDKAETLEGRTELDWTGLLKTTELNYWNYWTTFIVLCNYFVVGGNNVYVIT